MSFLTTGSLFNLSSLEYESKLLQALDNALAVIEFRWDGKIINANKNFLNMMGYTLEEVENQYHSMFVDPEYAQTAEYREFWKNILTGQIQKAEYKRFAKGGRVVWIEASYARVNEGKNATIIKIAMDITHHMNEYLSHKAQIQALSLSNAVVHFSPDGAVLDANSKFLDMMGYRIEEIKGRHHSMFVSPSHITTPEYREFWEKLNRGEFITTQCRRITKSGAAVWFEATYNPVFDVDGNIQSIVKCATDITKKMESHQILRSKVLLPFETVPSDTRLVS